MSRILSVRLLSIAALACAGVVLCYSQRSQRLTNFVIDTNREFVYVKFDHLGQGIQRDEGESGMRIWLRLVNNCHVPIQMRTFGVPEGSPSGEIGLMDQVVKDTPLGIEISDAPPPIDSSVLSALESRSPPSEPEHAAGPHSRKASEEPPHDYWFELGSLMILQPNQEILFSVPINQLGSSWHIQIPFEFEVPKGKVPRDPKVGGLPEMYVSYSRYDLPDDVRAKIYGQGRK